MNIIDIVNMTKQATWSWFICKEGENNNLIFTNWWM